MKLTPVPTKTYLISGVPELKKGIYLTLVSAKVGTGAIVIHQGEQTWAFHTPFPEQRHGESPAEWLARIPYQVIVRMMREQIPGTRWMPGQLQTIAEAVKRACTIPGVVA